MTVALKSENSVDRFSFDYCSIVRHGFLPVGDASGALLLKKLL
jgi:hypothetical protein